MMLRSSSTPVLGSLLPSISDSPSNNNTHHQSELHGPTHKHTPNSIHTKLSYTNGDYRKSLFQSPTAFRRVQSESNLEELADDSNNVDELSLPKKSARRNNCNLESIPSFSLRSSFEDEDSDEDEEIEGENDEELGLDYTYNSMRVEKLGLEQVRNDVKGYGGVIFEGEGKMYLATGLGVSGIDFGDSGGGNGGGGGSYRPVDFDRDGGDSRGLSMEQHYKRMLEKNPGNPLFLRNYAQFLYQVKGDMGGAEEYYSRAILADPRDGEIMSEYAKLIWEIHGDQDRAANYFKRAVEASSQDSNIHAAYASFLWDTDDDVDVDTSRLTQHPLFMASATA